MWRCSFLPLLFEYSALLFWGWKGWLPPSNPRAQAEKTKRLDINYLFLQYPGNHTLHKRMLKSRFTVGSGCIVDLQRPSVVNGDLDPITRHVSWGLIEIRKVGMLRESLGCCTFSYFYLSSNFFLNLYVQDDSKLLLWTSLLLYLKAWTFEMWIGSVFDRVVALLDKGLAEKRGSDFSHALQAAKVTV